jgi:hypothetical protein
MSTEYVIIGFQLRERVPVAGHQQQHREFVAERAHAAVEDVAGALEHDAREIVDQAGTVAAERGDDDELHRFLKQSGRGASLQAGGGGENAVFLRGFHPLRDSLPRARPCTARLAASTIAFIPGA